MGIYDVNVGPLSSLASFPNNTHKISSHGVAEDGTVLQPRQWNDTSVRLPLSREESAASMLDQVHSPVRG